MIHTETIEASQTPSQAQAVVSSQDAVVLNPTMDFTVNMLLWLADHARRDPSLFPNHLRSKIPEELREKLAQSASLLKSIPEGYWEEMRLMLIDELLAIKTALKAYEFTHVVYHWTNAENAEMILREGLKAGSYVAPRPECWTGEVLLGICMDKAHDWERMNDGTPRPKEATWQAIIPDHVPPERIFRIQNAAGEPLAPARKDQ